jgi:hypothetical protein
MAKQTRPKRPSAAKSQRARFIDAARQAEADESGKQFEKAFGKIVPTKLPPRPPKPAGR